MLKRASWLGAVALASMILSFALSQGSCQSTCATNADCGAGNYCSTATDICLTAQPVGFCKVIPAASECPTAVAEVCGCDSKQYQNSCLAAAAGFSVAANGPCSTSCGGPAAQTCSESTTYCHFMDGSCGIGNAVGSCDPVPSSCSDATPLVVCGCDGKTYPSRCDAQAAGTSVNTIGACPCGGTSSTKCETGKYCQFPAGTCTMPDPAGTCVDLPTTCSSFSSPVCGCDGKTYDNACQAAKVQMSVAATGLCPCGGPGGVTCAATEFCSYGLATTTTATCLTPGALGSCEPRPTSCVPVYAPVCGCDGVQYKNPCEAALGGTSVALSGPCPVPDGGADGG